jgi:hypothetical protein
MKNAQNEAKRDVTQADEGQEDKMQNLDSGGEKRSQFKDRSDVATEP